VSFGGANAPFTVISNTTVVTGVPAGASTGKIIVTSPGGTAGTSSTFSVSTRLAAPKIQGFSPSSGTVGTAVTVSGTNLGGITSASIGGVRAQFAVLAAGKVVITVPAGAKNGRISVTSDGGTGSSSSYFKVLSSTSTSN
jgi:hypothetical protein